MVAIRYRPTTAASSGAATASSGATTARTAGSAGSVASASHTGRCTPNTSGYEVTEAVERKLRTAVGKGNELVELGKCALGDEELRLLMKLLSDAEAAARTRAAAVQATMNMALHALLC